MGRRQGSPERPEAKAPLELTEPIDSARESADVLPGPTFGQQLRGEVGKLDNVSTRCDR
jgi:hypothetical protein